MLCARIRFLPTRSRFLPRDHAILCPVLFSPYKQMEDRLTELLGAVDACGDPAVRIRVTASPGDLPPAVANDPKIEFIGRVDQDQAARDMGT